MCLPGSDPPRDLLCVVCMLVLAEQNTLLPALQSEFISPGKMVLAAATWGFLPAAETRVGGLLTQCRGADTMQTVWFASKIQTLDVLSFSFNFLLMYNRITGFQAGGWELRDVYYAPANPQFISEETEARGSLNICPKQNGVSVPQGQRGGWKACDLGLTGCNFFFCTE